MTEDLKPIDLELRCEGMTLRGRRCAKKSVAQYEGSSYCGTHIRHAMPVEEFKQPETTK